MPRAALSFVSVCVRARVGWEVGVRAGKLTPGGSVRGGSAAAKRLVCGRRSWPGARSFGLRTPHWQGEGALMLYREDV